MIKKLVGITLAAMAVAGCQDDADIARHNAAKAADNFEVVRRIVLYNTFTDKNIMITEGKCSVEPGNLRTAVICKIGSGKYITNFYGKSDNSLYFVEQMGPIPLNVYHYRRVFKPQGLIPDIDFRGDTGAVFDALTPDNRD